MTNWTRNDLERIGAADELQLASFKKDGTLRNPVTIWVVCLGDDLYVRSWRGLTATWFRGTQVRHEGRIWVGGVEKEVAFVEEADADLNYQIVAAYRTKYRRYGAQYVNPMVAPEARAATNQARAGLNKLLGQTTRMKEPCSTHISVELAYK